MVEGKRDAPHRRLLADNFRWLRAAVPVSHENLANSLGLSRSFLSSIERGENSLRIDVLLGLAHGLNVLVWQLLFNEQVVAATETMKRKL